MNAVPKEMWMLYAFIGFLILSNLTLIATGFWVSLKGAWWLSKLDSRVKDNTKDVDAAHVKIREVRGEVRDLRNESV